MDEDAKKIYNLMYDIAVAQGKIEETLNIEISVRVRKESLKNELDRLKSELKELEMKTAPDYSTTDRDNPN